MLSNVGVRIQEGYLASAIKFSFINNNYIYYSVYGYAFEHSSIEKINTRCNL